MRKPSVSNWMSLGFPIAVGEQLRLGAIIKSDNDFFDPRC
jgi:hypothetical protein